MKTHQHTLTVFGAVIALLIAGVIAVASIPDANGLISGCYSKNGLRVIDTAAEKCLKTETPLSWNQRGLQGLNGLNGTNGLDGVSVTTLTLPVGDPHCPNGGSQFTSVSGNTYACNGAVGGGTGGFTFNDRVPDGSVFSIDLGDGLHFNGGCRIDGTTSMELTSTIVINTFISGGFREGTDFLPLLGTYGNIFQTVTTQGSFDVVMAMGHPETNLGQFRRISIAMFPDATGCRYLGTSDPAGH